MTLSAAEVEREVTTTISIGIRPVVDGHENLESLLNSLDQENRKVVEESLVAKEPTALLLVLKGAGKGNRFMVDQSGCTIGRSSTNDIFLDDITVSRTHASISFSEHFIFTDAGSLNGSYLNNERTTSVALKSGDEVQIGKFHLVFISNRSARRSENINQETSN